MLLILGIIIGLLLAIIWILLASTIPYTPQRLAKTILPSPKGSIITPTDDLTLSIQEKLERNREQGIDTPLSDL